MKLIFSFVFAFLFASVAFAQNNGNQGNTTEKVAATQKNASFEWKKATHDFGRIAKGKPVTAEFEFVNNGKLPLIISNARGSCGCTGVKYPTEPLAPGEKGMISATFNAASEGVFNKSVTVTANTAEGTSTLYIKGEVVSGE